MHRVLRLILAFVAGGVIGSLVNMGMILVGGSIVPPPAGADTSTVESLKASMHLFEARHFLFPFLAHALGTFVGATVAALLSPGRAAGPAYAVGIFFLLGGIASAVMLPAPVWFIVLDLVAAYLPTAWLAHRLVATRKVG